MSELINLIVCLSIIWIVFGAAWFLDEYAQYKFRYNWSIKKFGLDRPENLTTIGWICRIVILATGVLFYIIAVNIKKIFYKY